MKHTLKIREAAHKSGLSIKMIRYYEEKNLLPKPERSSAGYRLYTDRHIHILTFIRTARTLGFSMDDIRQLLTLWNTKTHHNAEVRHIASQHIHKIRMHIAALENIIQTLKPLIEECSGDETSTCPILKGLESFHRRSS